MKNKTDVKSLYLKLAENIKKLDTAKLEKNLSGIDLSNYNYQFHFLLLQAVNPKWDNEILAILVNHRFNLNIKSQGQLPLLFDALGHFGEDASIATLEAFMRYNADLYIKDGNGNNLLHYAFKKIGSKLIDFLLDLKLIDINEVNNDNLSPPELLSASVQQMLNAMGSKTLKAMDAQMYKKAFTGTKAHYWELSEAIRKHDINTVSILLENGLRVDMKVPLWGDSFLLKAVHLAITNGHKYSMAEILIDYGASSSFKNDYPLKLVKDKVVQTRIKASEKIDCLLKEQNPNYLIDKFIAEDSARKLLLNNTEIFTSLVKSIFNNVELRHLTLTQKSLPLKKTIANLCNNLEFLAKNINWQEDGASKQKNNFNSFLETAKDLNTTINNIAPDHFPTLRFLAALKIVNLGEELEKFYEEKKEGGVEAPSEVKEFVEFVNNSKFLGFVPYLGDQDFDVVYD